MRFLNNYQGSPEGYAFSEIRDPMERRANSFGYGSPYGLVARNLAIGTNFQRRNFYGTAPNAYLNNNGGYPLTGRLINYSGGDSSESVENGRYEDFIRNPELNSATHFLRNLDPIGGGTLVKKNLDHIGGPNLIKKTLDSLGGGNLVRRSDDIVGGKMIRSLDSIGGGNLV